MTDTKAAEPPPPCTLVIFGVTGDLTKRLLLPALRNLRRDGLLPDEFKLVGIASRDIGDEGLREQLRQAMVDFKAGTGDDDIDCNTANYSKAAVDIGDLATTGPELAAAMSDVLPGGLTPTGPALTGALDYASTWASDHVGRATAVVLVSDGYPTQCQTRSVTDLATIAKNAHLAKPYVRTYVIGLGGDVNLDAISVSGGTHQAFKVDEGDISASFVNALLNVANTKLACEYALPAPATGGQKLDLSEVSVTYTPAGDVATEEIPSISGSGSCANSPNGGWFYDDAANPTSIQVCPCTCSRFEAGRVDIRVGCKPIVGPR